MGQEVRQAVAGDAQVPSVRQKNDAEMIRILPVEAGPLHDQDMLFMQEIIGELHVVRDVEAFDVDLRENIKRCLGLHDGNARNIL